MKLSDGVKPISYLKAHAAEVIRDVVEHRRTIVITQHGEARVVLQDVETFEQTRESMAMLKLLALSLAQQQEGKIRPLDEALDNLRRRIDDAS